VELGGAQHVHRERAVLQRVLVGELRGAVAADVAVRADDRDDDDPLGAGARARCLQVARGGGEELSRGVLIGRGPGRRVDDRLRAGQRLVEALAGDDVHTGRS
jgi:hypothetical protein